MVLTYASWLKRFGARRDVVGQSVNLSGADYTIVGVLPRDFAFAPGDTLLVGRESAGVPQTVHDCVDARLVIPLRPGLRSLNVAQAAAMVLGEALRQTSLFPRNDCEIVRPEK